MGWLVTVAAAIGAWFLTGSTVVAIVGGICAFVLYRRLVPAPESRITPHLPSQPRRSGQPFRWEFRSPGVGSVVQAVELLAAAGLTLDSQDPTSAVLKGGSQLETRINGGYFIKPAALPVTVSLATVPAEDAVQIAVEDRVGPIGTRNRALEARYALRAAEIAGILDAEPPIEPTKS